MQQYNTTKCCFILHLNTRAHEEVCVCVYVLLKRRYFHYYAHTNVHAHKHAYITLSNIQHIDTLLFINCIQSPLLFCRIYFKIFYKNSIRKYVTHSRKLLCTITIQMEISGISQ